MSVSDGARVSLLVIDVKPGREEEFIALAEQLSELLEKQQYAEVDTIRDEGLQTRFFTIWRWTSAQAIRT